MKYLEGGFYHIYNQGNNRRYIFLQEENYRFFLYKMKKYLKPNASIIAYCLMPNHFHWLIQVKPEGVLPSKAVIPRYNGNYESISWRMKHSQQNLSHQIGILLSSYTKAMNKRFDWKGSLFRSNTHCKPINVDSDHGLYLQTCLWYIHSNPIEAGLARAPDQYLYSSAHELANKTEDMICDSKLIEKLGLIITVPNT